MNHKFILGGEMTKEKINEEPKPLKDLFVPDEIDQDVQKRVVEGKRGPEPEEEEPGPKMPLWQKILNKLKFWS